MNKKLKNILFFVLLAIIMFITMFVFPTKVSGDTKDYSINRLDVKVKLQEDGDALIKESWELEF